MKQRKVKAWAVLTYHAKYDGWFLWPWGNGYEHQLLVFHSRKEAREFTQRQRPGEKFKDLKIVSCTVVYEP